MPSSPIRNPAGSYDDAVALALSSDGSRLFITGVEWFSENRYATVAYDASTGKLVWVNYFVATAGFGEPTAVGVTRDGSTVVVTGTGGTTPTSDSDYWTVALTASTGAQLWASRYDGPAHDYDHASALGLSPDGTKAFVTGWSTGIGTGFDSATIAYSLT